MFMGNDPLDLEHLVCGVQWPECVISVLTDLELAHFKHIHAEDMSLSGLFLWRFMLLFVMCNFDCWIV